MLFLYSSSTQIYFCFALAYFWLLAPRPLPTHNMEGQREISPTYLPLDGLLMPLQCLQDSETSPCPRTFPDHLEVRGPLPTTVCPLHHAVFFPLVLKTMVITMVHLLNGYCLGPPLPMQAHESRDSVHHGVPSAQHVLAESSCSTNICLN